MKLALKKLKECAVSKTSVLDGERYIAGKQRRNAQTSFAKTRLKTIGRKKKENANSPANNGYLNSAVVFLTQKTKVVMLQLNGPTVRIFYSENRVSVKGQMLRKTNC